MRSIVSRVVLLATAGFWAQAEVRLLTGDANGQLHPKDSLVLDISADGNRVLFSSGPPIIGATPGITRGGLYVRDLRENSLEFVGVPIGGENNNDPTDAVEASMSDDGRSFAWASVAHPPLPRLIFWRNHSTRETRLITAGADADSRRPIISGDGRFVAYLSYARNLPVTPAHRPASGRAAVYLYDSVTGTTTVASLTHDGQGLDKGVGTGPGAYYEFDFSANGRFVVFSTDSSNVHPSRKGANQAYFWLYRRNLENGQVDVVSRNASGGIPNGNFTSPVIDAAGNRVFFTGSFVGLGGGALLVNGYSFVFGSDLYLKDLSTEEVWWVTRTTNSTTPDAAFGAGAFAISGDGQVVAFGSSGTKFVAELTDPPGSSDSFDIFKVAVGPAGAVTNTLVTRPAVGTNNVGYFTGPLLPHDGRYVAFVSRNHFPLIGTGENSSINLHGYAVGALPNQASAPSLALKFTAGSLSFQWPDTPEAAGFRLVYKTDLNQAAWIESNLEPVLQNGLNSATEILPPASRRYYILRRP